MASPSTHGRKPVPAASSASFTDAPSFHIIDHAIYHTDLDTAALVPEPGLEAAVRAFAKIIDEVNTVDIAALRAAPRASEAASRTPQA